MGDASQFPVRVALYVNDVEVASTWADQDPRTSDGVHHRGFRIALRDVWAYCKRSDELTIQIDGDALPISGAGFVRHPDAHGKFSLPELEAKFADGFLFGQAGRLQLSKKLDLDWQESVFSLYDRMSEVVRRHYGYEPFAIYGTLLGLVREGNFIGHDLDFDAAYLSRFSAGPAVAAELRDIGLTLIDAGFDVELLRTVLHVRDPDTGLRIDLFHLYFDDNGHLATPFGIAGSTEISRS